MTKEEYKINSAKVRLAILEGTPKNVKCPGVVRKLRRIVSKHEASQK